MKPMIALLVLLLGAGGTAVVSRAEKREAPPRAEILWDTWGVPHIFARDTEDLFYAFGWAQAQNHGDLLLRLYGRARGRGAEYWGEAFLAEDRMVRTLGLPNRAQGALRQQSPAFRRRLAAFAGGINAYARAHPDRIADAVEVVLPVDATDVLAHGHRVLFQFLAGTGGAAQVFQPPPRPAASNGWAVAPSRTADGRALLLANPHLTWGGPTTWFEAQLTGPGINAYGATLVGSPVLAIAFNDYLGWTHTVNTIDACDLYELTPAEAGNPSPSLRGVPGRNNGACGGALRDWAGNPPRRNDGACGGALRDLGGYRFDGKVRPFQTRTEILRVKQKDESSREERLEVRRSVHGPVFEQQGRLFALRCASLDPFPADRMVEQMWDMARARSFAEFQKALQRLQLPMFTVIYADRDGHIMHLFNGRVPVRSRGDFRFWQGIVPGDSSATLWTRFHSYRELPKVIDPPSGWVQNANSPPWVATFPPALDPNDYPTYMAPRFMSFREQHSARMIAGDRRISFQKLLEYKHSTRLELADRILDDLIAAAREHGGPLAREAADVLRAWDRRADADSRGAVLFITWHQEMKPAGPGWPTGGDSDNLFATPWEERNPRTTPRGLADPRKAAKALEAAAVKVKAAYGALDVPFGEVFRLRRGALDLPGNGATDPPLGTFRVIDYAPAGQNRFQSFGGDSYVAAVEFSSPVRAMALVSYGNASQPGSPHNGDQLKLAARKELRPVWRSRTEIEAHLASRTVLPEQQDVRR